MKKSFFDKQNRYSIRKLTVGVASVLIGFAFMSNSQSAKAATDNTNTGSANTETTKSNGEQPGDQSKTGVNYKNANSVAPQTAISPADGEKGQTQSAANDAQAPVATQAKTTPATTDVQKPVAPKGSEARPYAKSFMAQAPQAKAATAQNTQTVNDYSQFLSALRDTSVTNIILGQNIDFSSATLSSGPLNGNKLNPYEQINNKGIARKLTIDGAGFTLTMGNKYIDFTDANQTATNNWDITLTNFANISSSSTYGTPFYFDVSAVNGEKDYVTFDNDTINANRVVAAAGPAGSPNERGINVKFTGDNTINTTFTPTGNTSVSANSAFAVNSAEVVNGNTTINAIYTQPYGPNAANQGAVFTITNGSDLKTAQDSNFVVDNGATMTINTNGKDSQGNDSKNIMGISFDGTAKGANIDTAKEGVVRVKDGGKLEMNMTQGASQAIFASHVDVQSNGNLTIDTKQDTTGSDATSNHGNHYAPITLGNTTAAVGDTNDELRVSQDGVLKITREGVKSSTSPLISYGNSGVSAGKNFNLDIQGTLDLQDSAQDPNTMSGVANGTDTEAWAGLITMWGTSANDTVQFNNPDYVNLQRTGAQHGSLLRIEGNTNNTYINNGVTATTPLAQWDQGNFSDPSFVWYITKEHNQNNWGNNSNTFAKKGEDPKALLVGQTASQKLIDSNQTAVTLAPNQVGGGQNGLTNGNEAAGTDGVGYKPNYLNQIANQFNWWTPQRIAMGSKLADNGVKINDADKYQPETQTINTDTSHKLSDLTAADGIKDLITSDGTKITLTPVKDSDGKITSFTEMVNGKPQGIITSVEFTPNADGVELTDSTGATVDASKNFPAAGDYNANATVTYADGSQDTDVIIPIHVTAPTDASTYTPEQKPNSVDNGATSVPAANGVTDYKNDKDGTTTTTFPDPNNNNTPTAPTVTWDNPKPGQDPETGVPDGVDTSKPGIYDNIPATVTYPDGSKDKINETVVVGNVVDVTDNNNHNHDNTPDDPNAIPDGYELVNVTITNGRFGSDASATAPKKYLVKDNTSKDEFVSAVDPEANDGYSQSSAKWNPELPATFGKSDMNKTYNVAFSASTLDKDLFQPTYDGQTMKPSDTKTVSPKYTPSTDGKINVGGKAPEDTKYTINNPDLPAGMTATVTNDGTVTITTNNTPEGAVNIPVTVTYPDGTADKPDSETVYVPVYVTDNKGDETVTWGDKGAVVTKVDTSKLNAHETSDNSQVLNAASAVTVNGYALGSDGKISTTATPITVDPSKVTWSTTPDTVVATASKDGKKISNESIKVDLNGNTDAQNILGSKNSVVTTDPFTIDAKGAGAKNVTTPVDVTEGSDLTDDQFKALVDNNIPTDEIASTTWGTKPDKDGNGGVIKITFTDNGANGQPTYLNINIPASSLHMVPATTPTDQAGTYTPETKPNEVKNGATSIPAENGIKDYKDKDGNVVTTMPDKDGNPTAPTVTWDHIDDKGMPIDPATGNPIDTSKSGIYDDVPAKVTYPDGTVDDNVPETVVVGNVIDVTNNPKHDPTKDPAPDGYIYETFKAVNGSFAPLANTPAARAANPTTKIFLVKANTTVDVLSQLNPQPNEGFVAPGKWDKTVPTTFTTAGTYTITFSKGTTGSTDTNAAQYDVTYTPQIVKGGDNVTVNPIVTTKDGKTATVPTGTKYGFGKDGMQTTTEIDGEPVKINPNTGVITFTAPTDSSATMNIPVKVTYPDTSSVTPHAIVYVVNGKDTPVQNPATPGDVIKGKDNLPGDTKVDWNPTPDKDKTGDQKTTVTVTIPGVEGQVDIPTTVTYGGKDSDKYEPDVQGINTDPGKLPAAKDGITNMPGSGKSDELPKGTTVDWTDKDEAQKQIDGAKPGDTVNIPATVTYLDGSKDEVKIPVTINKPGDTGNKPTTPAQGAIVITYYDKNKGLSETVSQAPDITGSKGQPVSAADLKSAIDQYIPTGWVIDPNFVYPDAMTIPNAVNVPVVRAGDQGQVPPTNGGNQGGDKNPSTGDNQTPTDNGNTNNNQNTNNTGDNGMNNSNGNGSNANSGANTGMSNSGNGNSGMMNTSNTMNTGAKTSSKSSANMNANSKKLPQTGEAKNNAGIFGLAIASIAGLFGLAGSRKRREDK